jgi:hypothetical protein
MRDREKVIPNGSTACHTYTGSPVVTISKEGNVLVFRGSDSGDHMYREGYVLCNTGAAARYSTSSTDVGFGAASCTCSGPTCTVARNTADGRMRLTQRLTKPTGLNRAFDIQMTLQNIGGTTVSNVMLRRQATVDISGAFSEWHESTREASSAQGTKADGIPFSVRLRHITGRTATVQNEAKTLNLGDYTCNPPDLSFSGPIFGDYDSAVQYNMGVLSPGTSKAVTVQYLRD